VRIKQRRTEILKNHSRTRYRANRRARNDQSGGLAAKRVCCEDDTDDDKPIVPQAADDETTEVCYFCGQEDCTLCARMQDNLAVDQFVMRVAVVDARMTDGRFRASAWTKEKPTYFHAVEMARRADVTVEVTQSKFEDSWHSCHYCGSCEYAGLVAKYGGDVTAENLVACCMLCFLIKGAVPHDEFVEQCALIVAHLRKCPEPCSKPLFPGTHCCADHFFRFNEKP
jgi:hypothetical protein